MGPDAEDLARALAGGEGREVEFKQGLARDEKVARTLCAFANTRGGLLLVGVDDRGEPLGAPHPPRTAARLREIARRAVEPELAVESGEVDLAGRRLVWCLVPLSPARPHSVVGDDGAREVVVRVGSRNRAATAAHLAGIAAERALALGSLHEAALAHLAACRQGDDAAGFAASSGVGVQRAVRAVDELERAGRIVARGLGATRRYVASG